MQKLSPRPVTSQTQKMTLTYASSGRLGGLLGKLSLAGVKSGAAGGATPTGQG